MKFKKIKWQIAPLPFIFILFYSIKCGVGLKEDPPAKEDYGTAGNYSGGSDCEIPLPVTKVEEKIPVDALSTLWKMTSPNLTITLPLDQDYANFTYQFTVDWGDGKRDSIDSTETGFTLPTHTYSRDGVYSVSIWGQLPAWSFLASPASKDYITEVKNFGDLGYKNLKGAFFNCSNLKSFAGGSTRDVKSMSYMFSGATALTTLDLSSFNTSRVTDMKEIFNGASGLTTLDTTGWDVMSVTDSTDWDVFTVFNLVCDDPDSGGDGVPGTGSMFGVACN
jgi:surface protein